MSINKTIAKNTMFLYFRMMITMLVSLYTSRVVLQVLGENDYGLYGVVGGVVGMLSFLNTALSSGSSRFLVFELGTGNFEKLRKTFSTILSLHVALAVVIVILAETIGLWFLYNKANIPPDRMHAAVWVYHLSVLTTVLSITQVPYNASIISHEKVSIYAYTSILEVLAKLGVVFLLKIGNIDKLVLYAILLCFVNAGMMIFYRLYCNLKFKETKYKPVFDKSIMKSVAGYSGWNLISGLSTVFNKHGMVIITNAFFGPAIVAARIISLDVNTAALRFVSNFRVAANPQIVKKYASGDYSGSKQLLLDSSKLSFYLMFLIGFPIILLAEPLLKLWLVTVPEYSVIFLQLIIVKNLFEVIDESFHTALYAKGRLKENVLLNQLVRIMQFPIVYLLFKAGYSPVAMSYVSIVAIATICLIIKPIVLCKIVDYTLRDIMSVFSSCLKVSIAAAPIPVLLNYYLDKNLVGFFVVCVVSIICTLIVVFYLGIDREMRSKIVCFAKDKLYKAARYYKMPINESSE